MDTYKKKYEDALERAKSFELPEYKNIMASVFPELKEESEDEKTERILHSISSKISFHLRDIFTEEEFQYFDTWSNAWLEKQGKKNFVTTDEDEKIREQIVYAINKLNVPENEKNKLIAWFEKQSKQKEYTFKSIPRLLDMIEPTSKTKAYCQKLIDTLAKEGYNTDAKIVGECLKKMNGEDVPMAVMDEKEGEQKTTLRERYKNIAESEWFKKTHEGMSVSDDEKVDNVNKIEQKFKVGDWITNGLSYPMQISSINNDMYYTHNDTVGGDIESMDKEYHLWTIKDARPGDVLAEEPIDSYPFPFVAIYKKQNKEDFDSYCFIGFNGKFYEGEIGHSTENIHPATKEQCDIFFAEMKKAGYEWDVEKKKLKKIENRPMLSDFFNAEYERGKADALKYVDWSDEDEGFLNLLLSIFTNEHPNGVFSTGNITPFNGICVTSNRIIDWLKSLKDKVCPKQKWSKEDEIQLDRICKTLWKNRKGDTDEIYQQEQDVKWLKSLKECITWKPSDKQIHAFEQVYDWYNNNFMASETLTSLYNDLKKLIK